MVSPFVVEGAYVFYYSKFILDIMVKNKKYYKNCLK